MNTLANVWSHVIKLLDDGYSVIPIRDKDENVLIRGKETVLTKKSPYTKWERYQTVRATKEELYFMLEKYNTLAIATICGKVSGNLEGIDVDSKWLPEVVKPLFNAIATAFPNVSFRIIRTPSKGYHIVYRISDGVVPPNKKIAGRQSTDEELKENQKAKVKYFIESRGEGGYLAAAPTDGYIVVKDVPPPMLTWEQRCNLIAICESFSLIVKQDTYKPTKSESLYYSENPFEHFSKSDAAEQVLLNNGWTHHSTNSKAIYFTRPGSRSGGIHAAFLLDTKLYKFFTTNCEFDNDRMYNAASVKAILEFGGDKKRLFPALVNAGYGRIHAEKEYDIVKTAALSGKALPANVSETAKETLKEVKEVMVKKLPYGIFWGYNEKGNIKIDIQHFIEISDQLGFKNYNGKDVVHIKGKFVHKVTTKYYLDELKKYIHSADGDEMHCILEAYEIFTKHYGKHCVERLPSLDENLLIKDDRSFCYKFFKDCFVVIDKDSYNKKDYEELTGLVFYERVQQRNFIVGEVNGKYVEFLNLAVNYLTNEDYIEKIIGYLSHEYKDETTGYIIVQVEECEDPSNGGGTGKNLFVNLLSNTTTVCNRAGETAKFDEKFLQSWNYEKIFNLGDVPKNFNFAFLKEPSTGTGTLKKLFKDEINISVQDMPKFVVSTNYSWESKDGGIEGRIIPLEFSNFFSRQKRVSDYFGCIFPSFGKHVENWSQEDWTGYDMIIIKSIQNWLIGDLKLKPVGLSEGGLLKQFEQTYGETTRSFIQQMWPEWSVAERVFISNTTFKEQYDNYFKENELNDKYKISPQKMNKALADWCKQNGYIYEYDKSERETTNENPYGKPVKGRLFFKNVT